MSSDTRASAAADGVHEIRYSVTANLLGAALFGGLALLFVAMGSASGPWRLALHWIGVVGFSLGALYFLWRSFDRRPVIVLHREGLRDRRLGFGLIPWSRLTDVWALQNARFAGMQQVCLQFDRDLAIRRWRTLPVLSVCGVTAWKARVVIALNMLDVPPRDFVTAVRRLAPHADRRRAA